MLFILVATLLLLGIVGFTMAYFSSRTDIANEFQAGRYKVIARETFTSPSNWRPGETIPKTLTVTNEGDIPVRVRVCVREKWESDNGDELPLEQNGIKVAIVNYTYNGWYSNGRCFEYNGVLEPNETTPSLIDGVTLNPSLEADLVCTNITETKQRCASSGDWYDKGHYTLNLTVESIQAENSEHFMGWGANWGQEVTIGSEVFYVMYSDSDTTLLFPKYNLLVGNIYDVTYDTNNEELSFSLNKTLSSSDPGYGLQNSTARGFKMFEETEDQAVGVVPFSGSQYWVGIDEALPQYIDNGGYPYVYDEDLSNTAPQLTYDQTYGYGVAADNGYTISYYVKQYVNKLKELGAPSSIKGRLLSLDESFNFSDLYEVSYTISDKTKCETYISGLWDDWDLEYESSDLTSFCNDEYDDYFGSMYEYIRYGEIYSEDYDLAGLSDVVSENIRFNGSFWIGAADNYSPYNIDYNVYYNYDIEAYYSLLPYYNHSNYCGVRPVIEIPTSDLKERY